MHNFISAKKIVFRLTCLIMVGFWMTVGIAHAECTFFMGWVDNKDGTVRDPRNGLVWKRCVEGYEFINGICTGGPNIYVTHTNWDGAKALAQESRFLGKSDWRLPTKEEFVSVMGAYEDCKANENFEDGKYAASKAIVHRDSKYWDHRYWTSSPFVGDRPNHVWLAYLDNGDADRISDRNDGRHSVRLVRSSQILGGEAAPEFVNEKADRIAAVERQRLEEEARQAEFAHQRAVEIERQRIAEEAEARLRQTEQAKARKRLAAFRKSLREGDDTNCGPIIEVKGKLIKVAFAVANYGNEHWIKRDQILSPDYDCRFVNGQYQSLQ